ncbi:MmpS family transport accessory protein [Mycolicibacterium sp. XJ1819]
MSGPNPPENEGSEIGGQDAGDQPTSEQPGRDPGEAGAAQTGQTDIYSQAYSAPESEHFSSGPYVPADSALYDYDSYEQTEVVEEPTPPRWPWVVGVAAILAAVALVVSVSVLVTRTDTDNLAVPSTTTSTVPPVQDEITTTTPPPPPPPPPPPTEEPPPPPPETVTVTQEPPPPPPPAEEPPPPPPETSEAPPPTTTTTRAGPRQVTYSVTGTKAPGDIITVTYTDASGRSRTQRNVYIPWSLTVTPISQSEVGSVQASSLFLVSQLNCTITTSDGTVLSSNTNNAAQTVC